jgi:hypothetical protein
MNFRTRDTRFWLIASAAVAFFVVLVSWVFFISPERDSAASLRSQADDAQVTNATTAAKIAQLAKLDKNHAQLVAELRSALAGLPSDSGLPQFTEQLTAQAAAHHVTLSSMDVGDFTVPATTAPAADPTATDSTTDATATDGSDATATDTGTTEGGLPANVVSIPVTLITVGSSANQLAFLHDVRVTGPRRALVTSTQLSVAATSGTLSIDSSCTMTVSLTVYSAVRSSADRAEYAKLLQG